MSALLTAAELSEAARRFLEKSQNRRTAWDLDTDFREAYRDVAELGWTQLTIGEAQGGLGQDFRTLSAIYIELGRALSPVPLMTTMAAVDALNSLKSNNDPVGIVLEMIAAGDMQVAIAMVSDQDIQLRPSVRGETSVSATLENVSDAQSARHLLLLPKQAVPLPALLIDLGEPGAEVKPLTMWDHSRRPADVTLTNAPARILADTGPDVALSTNVACAHLDLGIACDSVGGAQQALVEAIDYMRTRQQFNRAVGSFQALKHRAADLKVSIELAQALTTRACNAFAVRSPNWERLAAQARLLAVKIYSEMGEEMVQFHGGIGVTWEHDCHKFLKRAKLNELGIDRMDTILERIAERLWQH